MDTGCMKLPCRHDNAKLFTFDPDFNGTMVQKPIVLGFTRLLCVSLSLSCPSSCEKRIVASHETNSKKNAYQETLKYLTL